MGDFANQGLGDSANGRLGTFATHGASNAKRHWKGVRRMFGKLAGAWIGSRIAGRQSGAKGAILGYGAAALARRSVPALAAIALGGWAFNKWRERRRQAPAYPSEAMPRKPASETRSPS